MFYYQIISKIYFISFSYYIFKYIYIYLILYISNNQYFFI